MQSKLSSSNAKAGIDLAPTSLLGIILGGIILIGLFYLGAKLAGIFISNQEYDSTINNFNVMIKHINNMMNDNDFSFRKFAYNLDNNFILVGFSYSDRDGTMHSTCRNENIKQSRPLLCEGYSCLCIYENTGFYDFDKDLDNRPLQCNKFDEKIVFLAPLNLESNDGFSGDVSVWQPKYYPDQRYEYLIAYGNGCNTFGNNFGIKELYLEKFKDGDNIYVYMTEYSEDLNSQVQKRINYITKNSNRK
jgi:hypothetical protein